MKIYKRKLSSFIISFFLNIIACFVFFILIANFIDLTYAIISTFVIYSILMFFNFVINNYYFTLERNIFRKYKAKKLIFEYDISKFKIKKELNKGIIGYSDMNILIGNHIINCSLLDLTTFEMMYRDLSLIGK
ncbi:hypothetical protein [Helcococcus bovis]|uniref:hypothetical protein n=1 Tax=Helcococcus bovis TaxID=3153252 RepID=UPI0038BA984B